MKKFLVVIAVLALTVISTAAMAEVTVSGSIDIRNLYLNNVNDFNDNIQTVGSTGASDKNVTTQQRVRLAVDAKNDNVKGRVQIENDWDVWGRFEAPQGNGQTSGGYNATTGAGGLTVREAWIDFNIPGAGGAHVKVGHQFLQLGNGWFFRSGKYGSDAWLIGLPGKNTIAFVNVKISEGPTTNTGSPNAGWGAADDVDAYVLLDNFKLDDKNTVGAYIAQIHDRRGALTGSTFIAGDSKFTLNTIGLWFNGVAGPAKLQAEFDYQMGSTKGGGTAGADVDFSAWQLVAQASMAMDALTLRAALGYGTGDDNGIADNEHSAYTSYLDKDPHYTLVYEYFTNTACKAKNTGFCNTTAVSVGADFAVTKNLVIGADIWYLKANEKVAIQTGAVADTELGTEIDLKVNWKITDQLTWNWALGRLMAGKAYDGTTKSADSVDAIQGILSYKF